MQSCRRDTSTFSTYLIVVGPGTSEIFPFHLRDCIVLTKLASFVDCVPN